MGQQLVHFDSNLHLLQFPRLQVATRGQPLFNLKSDFQNLGMNVGIIKDQKHNSIGNVESYAGELFLQFKLKSTSHEGAPDKHPVKNVSLLSNDYKTIPEKLRPILSSIMINQVNSLLYA